MISGGFKKLAVEHGMQASHGVAWGSFYGFAATFIDGMGNKVITVTTRFPDEENKSELKKALFARNLNKEFGILDINFLESEIVINFHDTVGTLKRIRAFSEWFFPLLKQHSAFGSEVCSECGLGLESGGKWKLVENKVIHVHESCGAELQQNMIREAENKRMEDTGSYGKGLIGAILGAAIGSILWALVLQIGYVAAIVGFVIGFLAEKGYTLLHGKAGKGKIAILVIATIFGVVLGTFGGDVIALAIDIGQNSIEYSQYGISYGNIPTIIINLLSDSEYLTATLTNIGLGLLFAFLGVFTILRKAGKEVSNTKMIDL